MKTKSWLMILYIIVLTVSLLLVTGCGGKTETTTEKTLTFSRPKIY